MLFDYTKEILYVNPSTDASRAPVLDNLTRKMTAALRGAAIAVTWRGSHECTGCGAKGDNADYRLSDGGITNVLSVHYLACHRSECTPEQLERVAALTCDEEEPTDQEIYRRE